MTAEIRPIRTAAEIGLAEAFAALRPRLAGSAVAARREAAFRRFEAVGLPHRRVEDWKYTDLRALMRDAKPLAAPPDAAAKARGRRGRRRSGGARCPPHRVRRWHARSRTLRSRARAGLADFLACRRARPRRRGARSRASASARRRAMSPMPSTPPSWATAPSSRWRRRRARRGPCISSSPMGRTARRPSSRAPSW